MFVSALATTAVQRRANTARLAVQGFAAGVNDELTLIQCAAEEILSYCADDDPVRPLILQLARASERAAYQARMVMITAEDFRGI